MPKDDDASAGQLLGIGLNIGIGVAVGYFVGRWLDNRYGWTPKGQIIGSLIGIAGGMYLLIKEAIRINKD